MNPLKEYPQLFTNGEFSAQILNDYVKNIRGYYKGLSESRIYFSDSINEKPRHCTLIARSIADMTDKELYEVNAISDSYGDVDDYDLEEWRRVLRQWLSLDELKFATVRYLLSIGVYPFDQSHFEDGTVIDINKI